MPILLIGATGQVGGAVAQALIQRGQRPVIGARNLEKAKSQWGDAASYRPFDFEKPDTFAPALAGIDACFFVAPRQRAVETVLPFLRHAQALKQLVFSSGRTTADVPGKPMHAIEEAIRSSGIPYTILRPGWFMQNFTGWVSEEILSEEKIILPAGKAKSAFVDVRDIGEVAATVLLENGRHYGETYELVSDEAFGHYEVAAMLSENTGKDIRYIPMDSQAYVAYKMERGWPREQAEHTAMLYELIQDGKEAVISRDIEEVLGRKPRRLSAFLEEHYG